jgi:hypothetical protein
MGWGFRKRAGLFGGLVRVSLSKHVVRASLGVPGLHRIRERLSALSSPAPCP